MSFFTIHQNKSLSQQLPRVRKRSPFHYRDLISSLELFYMVLFSITTKISHQIDHQSNSACQPLCSLSLCHVSKAETLLYYLVIRKLSSNSCVLSGCERAHQILINNTCNFPSRPLAATQSCYDMRSTHDVLGDYTGMRCENSGRTGALAQNALKKIVCTIIEVMFRR